MKKKGFLGKNKKLSIKSLLLLLVLVMALVVGVILAKENQDIREDASICILEGDVCTGMTCCKGLKCDSKTQTCISSSDYCVGRNMCATKDQKCCQGLEKVYDRDRCGAVNRLCMKGSDIPEPCIKEGQCADQRQECCKNLRRESDISGCGLSADRCVACVAENECVGSGEVCCAGLERERNVRKCGREGVWCVGIENSEVSCPLGNQPGVTKNIKETLNVSSYVSKCRDIGASDDTFVAFTYSCPNKKSGICLDNEKKRTVGPNTVLKFDRQDQGMQTIALYCTKDGALYPKLSKGCYAAIMEIYSTK